MKKYFFPEPLYSDKMQLCLRVRIKRASNLYLKQVEIEKKNNCWLTIIFTLSLILLLKEDWETEGLHQPLTFSLLGLC